MDVDVDEGSTRQDKSSFAKLVNADLSLQADLHSALKTVQQLCKRLQVLQEPSFPYTEMTVVREYIDSRKHFASLFASHLVDAVRLAGDKLNSTVLQRFSPPEDKLPVTVLLQPIDQAFDLNVAPYLDLLHWLEDFDGELHTQVVQTFVEQLRKTLSYSIPVLFESIRKNHICQLPPDRSKKKGLEETLAPPVRKDHLARASCVDAVVFVLSLLHKTHESMRRCLRRLHSTTTPPNQLIEHALDLLFQNFIPQVSSLITDAYKEAALSSVIIMIELAYYSTVSTAQCWQSMQATASKLINDVVEDEGKKLDAKAKNIKYNILPSFVLLKRIVEAGIYISLVNLMLSSKRS